MQHCADKQAYQVTRICKGRAVGVEKVKFVKAVTIFLNFNCCLFVEYEVNQDVLCYSGGNVFEAIVMSAFVDAGMVNYYVFSRTSAEPIVAQQLELQYFFSDGKQVNIIPGECESNPYELPAAEALSFPPVIEVKKEFPIGKKVNTFSCPKFSLFF